MLTISPNNYKNQNVSFGIIIMPAEKYRNKPIFSKTKVKLIDAFEKEGFSQSDAIGFVTSQLRSGLKSKDLQDIVKQLKELRSTIK